VRRREFITLLGGAAAWPVGARTQNGKAPIRLGFVPLGSPPTRTTGRSLRRFDKV
jgi:hypothetical protein